MRDRIHKAWAYGQIARQNPVDSVTHPTVAVTRFDNVVCNGGFQCRGKNEEARGRMMTLTALIWMLVIGAIAGWLAGLVMKGRGFGVIGNIVVGIVGAVIGGFLFNALGIAFWGLLGALLVAFIGAVILLFIVGLVKRA
jgi:uncharacterized membrane protein YeaQ/YmgE (transglycosylase-associated protein family)